jgi:hypothetical protein
LLFSKGDAGSLDGCIDLYQLGRANVYFPGKISTGTNRPVGLEKHNI